MLLSTTAIHRAVNLQRREHRIIRRGLSFCALSCSEHEGKRTIHIRLSKVNKSRQRDAEPSALFCISTDSVFANTNIKPLYDGKIKEDPRHSSAADKALRCLILNPGTAN